jgi:hypothetical protein
VIASAGCRQDLPSSSSENSPFVAWHSGRENSTGRETSFCVVEYTGRFGGEAFGRKQRQNPHPSLLSSGTREIKSRTKIGQIHDELPEWGHLGRGESNEEKHGCEWLAHPPSIVQAKHREYTLRDRVLDRKKPRCILGEIAKTKSNR